MLGFFSPKPVTSPPILAGASDLLTDYETIFCDVWGVVHNGVNAHESAVDALLRFRAAKGTVILVSNAPVPKARVADMLASKGVPDTAYDDIVSSGDIALRHIAKEQFKAVYSIGPRDRDSALFNAIDADFTDLAGADAIICTGLNDDLIEVAEDYDSQLEQALARRLPFVCANPDKYVDVGGKLYLCAGAIADRYEAMGGSVFWAGKPHASAYGTAREIAQQLRDQILLRSKILAIGDAMRTDLKAAKGAGVDALFIAGGIHRDDVMVDGELCPDRLKALFKADDASPAIGAMPQLAW